MPSAEAALFWLPTAAVAVVTVLAVIVALAQPPRLAKAVWLVLMAYLALGRARSGLVTSPYRLDTPPDRNWAPVPG